MFTGIIEEQGEVFGLSQTDDAAHLVIQSNFSGLQTGESIAINGVCLTLLPGENTNSLLAFDLSPETLRLTSLGSLKPGDTVNLERAMLASERFGGHYVSGHVDRTALVQKVNARNDFVELTIHGFTREELRFLLPKGSITIEGVSLTINAVKEDRIELMLIPHTLSKTTLGTLSEGQAVNVEFDYLTRIVAHQLQVAQALI